MRLGGWFALGLIVAALAAYGCSQNRTGQLTGVKAALGGVAAGDSVLPPTPPGPPPPPSLNPIQWVSCDTVAAGQTSMTRWRVGNEGNANFTVHWSLGPATDWTAQVWPVFPITGTLDVPPYGIRDLDVPVAVPDSTTAGFYIVSMTVTRFDGGLIGTESGIRVYPH